MIKPKLNPGLDPSKLEVGYMILGDHPEHRYYGIVTKKDDKQYVVQWYGVYTHANSYPYKSVTGLSDDRIVADKKQQLEIKLRVGNDNS